MINLEALNKAYEYLGKDNFQNLNITFTESSDKSLVELKKTGNNVEVIYGQTVNAFYALTLLKMNKDNDCDIKYNRNFNQNGLMHDCSRNGPLKVSTVKEYILIHALLGLNRILLYTEETYEIDGYKHFGYLRGAYTREEIKNIVKYAKDFGVDVVPCIQTLSHLARTLRWVEMWKYRESEQTLCPFEEATYEFIEDMIKACREYFDSKYIHIGMDEALDLGAGRYMYKGIAVDRTEAFLKHVNRVVDICKKYDFIPMMWGDMFFKFCSNNADYYKGGAISKEISDMVPDVQLVYWDYYHADKKDYINHLDNHMSIGREVLFAGGSIRWIGFAPSIEASFINSSSALSACLEKGIKSVFCTAWGDNGNETTVFSSLPALVLYSLYDFTGKASKEDISKILETLFNETYERMVLLDLPNGRKPGPHLAYSNVCKPFTYQDVLLGLFDKHVGKETSKYYFDSSNKLNEAAQDSSKFSYIYKNLANLCSFLSIKVDLGNNLRNAYANKDKKELARIIDEDIPLAIGRLDIFLESMRYQWMKENKAFGFDVTDGRLGFLKNRLKTAIYEVRQYLNGEVDIIEEFEKEILPWEDASVDDDICANAWWGMSSVNEI